MAHELDFSTGQAGIAYVGAVPWHGYGQRLEDDASLDEWRIAAGLDWDITERPALFNMPESDEILSVPNRKVLVRSDNLAPLSVVSGRYQVVQPEEVMEFYRDLIEAHGFKMHTAGCLREGRRVWALAETGKELEIDGDKVGGYLLLATSYDASMATTVQLTSVRVVCNNTLELSMSRAGSKKHGNVSISHSSKFDPRRAKLDLGLIEDSWGEFGDNVTKLVNTKVDRATAIGFFMDILEMEDATGKVDITAPELKNVRHLMAHYENGPGARLATAHGTAWGLLNAVTLYQDHTIRALDNGTRINSAWFGKGRTRKNDAFKRALELAA